MQVNVAVEAIRDIPRDRGIRETGKGDKG